MRAFIAGGSLSELPIIHAALLEGLRVTSSGNRPSDVSHIWSHRYVNVDFSDKEALLQSLREDPHDLLISGANDFSYLSCCYVAEVLNYPGFDSYETALELHHKDRFRQLAGRLGLPRVGSAVLDMDLVLSEGHIDLKSLGIEGRAIAKPVDLTGGKGIFQLEEGGVIPSTILDDWKLSRSAKIVVEEYFEGSLHSYSTVIRDRKVIFEHWDNEYCFYNPYLVSTSETSTKIPQKVIAILRDASEEVSRFLHLKDGVLHCQFLFDGEDVVILEYTRRMSGDLYSFVVSSVHGWRHEDLFIHQASGTLESYVAGGIKAADESRCVSRHCITSSAPGVLSRIKVDQSLKKYIKGFWMSRRPNDILQGLGRGKCSVLILEYPSEEIMNSYTRKIHSLTEVELCPQH